MSLTVTEDFVRGTWDLISCHSPLVLKATLQNLTATASSGDVTCDIQAVSFGADDDTLYTFDMAYVQTSFASPNYFHEFRLDITDIIRKICNGARMEDETGGAIYKLKSKRATEIDIDVKSSGEATQSVDNWYMHGFNQVNNPDSSCLVDFADVNTKAIISIVPGAPMLWYLWNPTNLGGTNTFNLYDSDDVLHYSPALPDPVTFGLVQFYNAPFNDTVRQIWGDKVEEFYFTIFNTTIQQKVYGVAFKQACDGDIILGWLNRYGTYSYLALERFPTHRGEQKHIGEYNITVDDLAEVQSRTKSRGYENVRDVISAVAKGIPTQYLEVVEDLFYSMDVYYYNGTLPEDEFNAADWLRVKIRGNLVNRKKQAFENVRVDIMLPEKYTQVR